MKSCQDLSLAGKRKGLAGERSGLFYEFVRIVEEMREATNGRYPAVAVFENVDGLLSSNAGRDFAHVLAGLQERGAAVSWRVWDAQFFSVPQRRRRVFIVADFAPVGVGEERAAQVLALRESLCRHPEAGAEARQGSAGAAEDGAGVGGVVCSESGPGWWNEGFGCLRAEGENRPSRPSHVVLEPAVIGTITANYGNQNGQDAYGCLVAEPVAAEGGNRTSGPLDVAACLSTSTQRLDFETQTLIVAPWDERVITSPGNGSAVVDGAPCPTLHGSDTVGIVAAEVASAITASAGHHGHSSPRGDGSDNLVAMSFETRVARNGRGAPDEVVHALKAEAGRTGKGDAAPCVMEYDGLRWIVRRLTPVEGERCQGWPDDWSRWRADGSEISDSARWRMIGNGVATPVAEWIARRLRAALEAS